MGYGPPQGGGGFSGGSITSAVTLANGASGTPSLGFTSQTALGFYKFATGVIGVSGGGFQWPTGLGAISHIKGPADANITIEAIPPFKVQLLNNGAGFTVNQSGNLDPVGTGGNINAGSTGDLLGRNLQLTGAITIYGATNTAGTGVPAIYASGRAAAQAASAATLINAFAVPAADSSYLVAANALVTTLGSGNFTMTVAYTDESNAARTATLAFQVVAGTVGTAISTAAPYMGQTIRIRCKASTTITVATTGTFTGCTYNAEASLLQVA